MIVATVVCAVALVFLFKELNKTKKDIDGFRNFSAQVVRHLSAPPEEPVVPETEVETNVETNVETKESEVKKEE